MERDMLNCIIIDDDPVVSALIEGFVLKTKKLNLISKYNSAVEAMDHLDESSEIDVIFLDVEMPEMSGLELLDSLQSKPMVIIISGSEKYALEAFNYDVTDYLLKPITYARFYKATERAYQKRKGICEDVKIDEKSKDEIFIKENSNLIKVKFSDILFVEAQENYVSLQSVEKRYLIHFTMKGIEKVLPSESFVRVHRSYFVNTNHIDSISGNRINVKVNGEMITIPIGKSYRPVLLDRLNLIN